MVVGTLMCPVFSAGCELLITSSDPESWFWSGLGCSRDAQEGEEAEEDEEVEGEGRGNS